MNEDNKETKKIEQPKRIVKDGYSGTFEIDAGAGEGAEQLKRAAGFTETEPKK